MQQQFQLTKTVAKIDSFTPRAEKHGKENKAAGTLKISLTAHGSVLNHFDERLRPLLFRRPAAGEQQQLIDGDNLTELAMPHMAPIRLNEKFPGYTLGIESGLDLSTPMELDAVELSAFQIEAQKGGTVKLSFNAACHPDGEEQFGALCKLIQNKAEITLTPPKPEQVQQMPLGGQGDTLDQQEEESDEGEATPEEVAAERAHLIEKGRARDEEE